MSDPGSGPLGEIVDGLLGEPVSLQGTEEAVWRDALDGLRARLRERGALPERPRAPDDAFGLDWMALERARPAFEFLYHRWFRVRSSGHENIPWEGPAIFVANHGGLLPFDGAMLVTDALLHRDRLLRALVDRWVRELPFVRPLFASLGQVIGTRENFRGLLAADEWVLVFPEGMSGIRKSFASRFELEPFHPGFVEEAVRFEVPVVPVAVAGPERQAPLLAELPGLATRLGLPAFPITPTFPWLGPLGLVPYPVRYRIHYGPPIPATELARGEPQELADELRERLQSMVEELR